MVLPLLFGSIRQQRRHRSMHIAELALDGL
jgi:hypothetical protein